MTRTLVNNDDSSVHRATARPVPATEQPFDCTRVQELLAGLPKLRALDISDTAVTAASLDSVANTCPEMQALNALDCHNLGEPALAAIRRMTRLVNVQLSSKQLDAGSAAALADLPRLQVFNAPDCAVAGRMATISASADVRRPASRPRSSRLTGLPALAAAVASEQLAGALSIGAPLRQDLNMTLEGGPVSRLSSKRVSALDLADAATWHLQPPAMRPLVSRSSSKIPTAPSKLETIQ